MLPAGALDRRIVIEAPTESTVFGGGPVFSQLAAVWSEVRQAIGEEARMAGREGARLPTRFRIRWRDDINTRQRIVFGGLYYDIVSVAEIGRHDGLEILAIAQVG